jgi:hypothetical protein
LKRKYLYAAAVFLILAGVSTAMILKVVRKPGVRFSRTEAFSEEAFDLTLSGGLLGGTIYYTTDGSTPTLESEVYREPIHIEAGLPDSVTVVKAARLEGGKLGSVCTQTYFVGEGVESLFDTMVVSLSTDEANLYDEETGIFTNYEKTSENGEWDRPAYIEFYESDGNLMLKQGTGIAVSGHGSRGYDQKSIKLIGNSIYDMDHPTFEYDFFDADMAGNTTDQSYNKLVLRNGGSDHEGTMLKWNVVSHLAKESGIICAGARPGVLFLNGTYYGIIQLQEKYTRYNVAHAIGAQKGDIEKYEPNEVNSSRFGGYYNRLHSDLNDPERQEKLESSVDMEDMLKHYAVNLIMNNVDWPFHNFLSWKCASTSTSAYGDDRVRFFLYDLDAVYQDTSEANIQNEFDYLMNETIEDMTDTFSLLMQSDKYRTQFVNLVCDLTSTAYDAEHVIATIEEEDQKLANSIALYYTEEEKLRQQAAVEEMKAIAATSCDEIRQRLESHLGAADPYTLTVEAPEDAVIRLSQIELEPGEQYTGVYYHNYPLTLTAERTDGKSIYGWIVNGEEVRDPELLLDDSYEAEEIQIQLITEP